MEFLNTGYCIHITIALWLLIATSHVHCHFHLENILTRSNKANTPKLIHCNMMKHEIHYKVKRFMINQKENISQNIVTFNKAIPN